MNMLIRALVIFCCLPFLFVAQSNKHRLPEKLREISGLALWQDSILVAINDSGNSPTVYFMNLSGELFHVVNIENAKNIDWEDLTLDDQNNLYVADVGNNSKSRKNLSIYYFSLNNVLNVKTVWAKIISFQYEDTAAYPQANTTSSFDCEALAYFNGNLYLFTKDLDKPFNGLSSCYQLEINEKNQVAKKQFTLQTPKQRKMILDAVTSADIYLDTCYLLTYSDVFALDMNAKTPSLIKVKSFGLLSQKEALCVDKQYFYVANERSTAYRKQKLFKIRRK